jgi:uncharacterized alkaline shock family protein YloU
VTATEAALPDARTAPEIARGITDIADRVVERIAGRAAAEVDDVLPAPRTGIARLGGADSDPTVDAHVDGKSARLEVRLAIAYPAPIRRVAQHVQSAVRTRVEHLTGLHVVAVHVEVVATPVAQPAPRRVH